MTLSTVSYLYIERQLKSQEHRLTAPLDVVCEELDAIIGARIASAPDDDARNEILSEALKKRPHYSKEIMSIEHGDIERAFGSSPTLKAQGELIRRFGEPSVVAAAAQWNTKLGSLKPGRDPDGGESRKKRAEGTDVPPSSKNPFSPDWKCSRVPKNPADKEAMRHEAMTAVIRNFGTAGAARFAKSVGMTIAGTPLRK